MRDDDEAKRPLSGLRVLDLSSEISGAYCSKLLVDAGADVVKVEAPDGGDSLRDWVASGTALPDGEDGALFRFLNASKRSIALDVESAAGRRVLLDLAAGADLVIESFGPGILRDLGLGLDVLQARNPRLSLVSLSPWGDDGPSSERPATEFTLQAATGSIGYRGLPGRKPVYAGGRLGEWAAGAFAAVGAMAAWLVARADGAGQHVDVSMFEAMLLCLTVYHDLNGQWVEGDLARSIEIPSIEPAKDGWVGFCTITGQQWMDFCSMLGRQDIAEDHRYLDGRLRMKHIGEMQSFIHEWTRQRTVDEIVELGNLLRIPTGPIGNGRTLPEMDQLVARGVFLRGPHGFLQPRPPYLLEKTPLRPIGPAPRLDEHGDEIRRELARAKPATEVATPIRHQGPAERPLAGLKVLDMTTFWAGPFCTTMLSDLGADVLKVESVQRPDGMRFAGSIPNDRLWEWSPVFHGANPGKRDVTLGLDSEEGMALIHRLISQADVLAENFSARVMENFGLGWEQVREINPDIIMLRMPAFGLDGPWRDRPGFAMSVEQVSGLAWITGYRDLPLVVRGACDPLGGVHAVFALLMALEHKRSTGEGQLVELPLLEVAVNLAAEQVIEHSAYGALLERDENRGPVSVPQGVYACGEAGELIALAVPSDIHWQALRHLLEDPAWMNRPELVQAPGRRAAHDEIDAGLERWLSGYSADEAVELLLSAGVPAQRVINGHSLMPNRQLEHRAFFQEMTHPVTGPTRYPGLPMRFSRLPRALHTAPPPTLGQDNDAVLADSLGLSRDEIEALRARQVIGERPSFM